LWLSLAATARAQSAGAVQPAAFAPQAVVGRYCLSCHNGRLKTGGLALDAFDLSRVADHPDVWRRSSAPQGEPIMKRWCRRLVFLAPYVLGAARAGAQTPAATFDVASVKPNRSGSTQVTTNFGTRP